MSRNTLNLLVAAGLGVFVLFIYVGPANILAKLDVFAQKPLSGVSKYMDSEDRLQLSDGTFDLDFVLPDWFDPTGDLGAQMKSTGDQTSTLNKRIVQLIPQDQSATDYDQSFQIDIKRNHAGSANPELISALLVLFAGCTDEEYYPGHPTALDRSILVTCGNRNDTGRGDVTALVQSKRTHLIYVSQTWVGPAFVSGETETYPVSPEVIEDAFQRMIALRQK